MKPIHGREYVYAIQYHIVWCTKYRKKVLTGKIENRFHEILYKIAEDNHFEIQEMNGEADHIHLLVSCSPQIYSGYDESIKRSFCKTADERIL